jgi:hypothetical protein
MFNIGNHDGRGVRLTADIPLDGQRSLEGQP